MMSTADSSEAYKESQCPRCYAYFDFYGSCPVCGYGSCPVSAQRSSRNRGKRGGRRGRAYLRHQRRLAKYNLTCSCWICRYEKRRKMPKPKYSFLYSSRRAGFEER